MISQWWSTLMPRVICDTFPSFAQLWCVMLILRSSEDCAIGTQWHRHLFFLTCELDWIHNTGLAWNFCWLYANSCIMAIFLLFIPFNSALCCTCMYIYRSNCSTLQLYRTAKLLFYTVSSFIFSSGAVRFSSFCIKELASVAVIVRFYLLVSVITGSNCCKVTCCSEYFYFTATFFLSSCWLPAPISSVTYNCANGWGVMSWPRLGVSLWYSVSARLGSSDNLTSYIFFRGRRGQLSHDK